MFYRQVEWPFKVCVTASLPAMNFDVLPCSMREAVRPICADALPDTLRAMDRVKSMVGTDLGAEATADPIFGISPSLSASRSEFELPADGLAGLDRSDDDDYCLLTFDVVNATNSVFYLSCTVDNGTKC